MCGLVSCCVCDEENQTLAGETQATRSLKIDNWWYRQDCKLWEAHVTGKP